MTITRRDALTALLTAPAFNYAYANQPDDDPDKSPAGSTSRKARSRTIRSTRTAMP